MQNAQNVPENVIFFAEKIGRGGKVVGFFLVQSAKGHEMGENVVMKCLALPNKHSHALCEQYGCWSTVVS